MEWLNSGYVIDMPLPKEGSWPRITVPDKKNKQFTMEILSLLLGLSL
jgi:hypothetical protein